MLALDRRQRAVLLGLLDQLLAVRALELDRHPHVLRFGGQIGQPKAERIGPKLLDDVDRIDAVALRLRHALAIAVEDLRMDEDLVERHFADVVQAHQHHPRHPKRNNVAAGNQHIGRIVVFQAASSSGGGSGQPSVECGQRAELNQVSRTSDSRFTKLNRSSSRSTSSSWLRTQMW